MIKSVDGILSYEGGFDHSGRVDTDGFDVAVIILDESDAFHGFERASVREADEVGGQRNGGIVEHSHADFVVFHQVEHFVDGIDTALSEFGSDSVAVTLEDSSENGIFSDQIPNIVREHFREEIIVSQTDDRVMLGGIGEGVGVTGYQIAGGFSGTRQRTVEDVTDVVGDGSTGGHGQTKSVCERNVIAILGFFGVTIQG
ncbi:MAG: hypothetical protein C4543_02960 [Ignavibacteriales bacterium]|nr:MAG: hypothetical protein C4543_02960 [Ignavibacteriales bacterium]